MQKPELISPAGDLEKLKIAFQYGADAVYASTPKFSMRTREIGFDEESLEEGIRYAHGIGKKVYLTLNIFPHSSEIIEFKKHALKLISLNPDAIIVADPGVLQFIKDNCDIPIHLSTQANTVNHLAVEFWRQQGVERIVLARELSLDDIKIISQSADILLSSRHQAALSAGERSTDSKSLSIDSFMRGNDKKKSGNSESKMNQNENNINSSNLSSSTRSGIQDSEKLSVDSRLLSSSLSDEAQTSESNDGNDTFHLEAFVHGAMCMAYSGRCQISNYMTGRDPNKGACIQACRFKYKMFGLEEDLRKGEIFPVYEDNRGTYLLNSKDLCMIEHIPDLIEAGIKSFKIEGRLKSIYYVGAITRAYRKAIDLYFDDQEKYKNEKQKFLEEVKKTSNRAFTTGFYYNKPNQDANNYETSRAQGDWGFIGLVKKYDSKRKVATIEAKNQLKKGSLVEIVTPDEVIVQVLESIVHKGENVDQVHAGYIFELIIEQKLPENSFLRVKMN